MSAEEIRKYVHRFANSRPWYKKLSFKGEEFVIFPYKGNQPLNPLCNVNNGIIINSIAVNTTTWWVYEKAFLSELEFPKNVAKEIKRNSFVLNCFLNGTHYKKSSGDEVKGWQYITKHDPEILFKLHKKHPGVNSVVALVSIEQTEQIERAVAAAERIKLTLSNYFEFNESVSELTLSSSDSTESYQKEVIYVSLPSIRVDKSVSTSGEVSIDSLSETTLDRKIDNVINDLSDKLSNELDKSNLSNILTKSTDLTKSTNLTDLTKSTDLNLPKSTTPKRRLSKKTPKSTPSLESQRPQIKRAMTESELMTNLKNIINEDLESTLPETLNGTLKVSKFRKMIDKVSPKAKRKNT